MQTDMEFDPHMQAHNNDISELLDLVTLEHLGDVADLLLGFLVTMPDPTPVREPVHA